MRINATPSGLPFKSTGLVTYPQPPQFGQSSGFTPLPPQCYQGLSPNFAQKFANFHFCYETRTRPPKPWIARPGYVRPQRLSSSVALGQLPNSRGLNGFLNP